jgi:hypothetical protein
MLGIDPFEIVTVEIESVKFDIAMIPYRKKLELEAKLASTDLGVNLKDEDGNVKKEVTADDIKGARITPEAVLVMSNYSYDLVRFGVRAHRGLIVKGKDIAFETEQIDYCGKKIEVVSERIMAFYAANKLIQPLVEKIRGLSNPSEQEIKN